MLHNLLNRMQNNEGWLTNLSPGVESQFQIPLANHLHHKEKRRLFKTLAYILRIPACRRVPPTRAIRRYVPDARKTR